MLKKKYDVLFFYAELRVSNIITNVFIIPTQSDIDINKMKSILLIATLSITFINVFTSEPLKLETHVEDINEEVKNLGMIM